MKDTVSDRVRFGVFELDLRAGELCKGVRIVRLQEKPFRLLQLLIEHKGGVVTRDEVQKRLWPNDTIVDFEHGINSAIKRLRQVLDDSADQPKYIETLARRGYRLTVPVEWVSPAGDKASNGTVASGHAGVAARMQLASVGLIGKKVSHYRVLEVAGGGGMGLVYKAEDLKLGRRVALKFLPEELATDSLALQRFEREARTASSLNHPNICTIYEVEEHEAQPFIVMELLEGETLRDRLAAARTGVKPIGLAERLDIAIPISEGLQAAHEKGIIHRDIKPANIFLTTQGKVKILDFGLAKLAEGEGAEAADENAERSANGARPRITTVGSDATLTRAGVAMGTAGYMSPEQARGERLDARTDIFSFGLVLYEMATSKRAFTGETEAILHDAILNHSPVPIRELNSTVPAKLVATIDKCLEKDRERRHQSAAEVRIALEEVRRNATPLPASSRRLKTVALASCAILLVAACAAGIWWWRRPLAQFAFQKYRMTALTSRGNVSTVDISPDGGYLVYSDGEYGAQSLWVQQLATSTTVRVLGPVSSAFGDLRFAHDGNYFYYAQEGRQEGHTPSLSRLSVLGGPPQRIVSDIDNYSSGDISADGKQIVFSRRNLNPDENYLLTASADGRGERRLLTLKGTELIGIPTWAPDGQTIAFAIGENGSGKMDCVATISGKGGRERRILRNAELISGMAWLPDQSGLVIAFWPLDGGNSSLEIMSYPDGNLRKVTSDLSDYVGVSLTRGAGQLVTIQKQMDSSLWVAPAHSPSEAVQLPEGTSRKDGIRGVTWAPGGQLVYGIGNQSELWLVNRDGSNRRQLTNTSSTSVSPSVTAAGSTIVFSRLDRVSKIWNIWAMDMDGSNMRQITRGTPSKRNPAISPDGKWIVYGTSREGNWKMLLSGGETTKLNSTGRYWQPTISPDGHWIAFQAVDDTDKKIKIEIVASDGKGPPRFLPSLNEPQIPYSTNIMNLPFQWTASGNAVTYVRTQNGVSNIWSQPIDGSPARQLTNFNSMLIWSHDWSRDGKYLVMARGNFSRDAVMLTDVR